MYFEALESRIIKTIEFQILINKDKILNKCITFSNAYIYSIQWNFKST